MSYIQKRGKNTAWRKSVMRNLLTDLVIYEKIKTTEAKAKELKKHADKLVTLGKKGTLHARRQAARILRNISANDKETALQKLFNDVAKRYKNRNGGYTRILKLDNRRGDDALIVQLELV